MRSRTSRPLRWQLTAFGLSVLLPVLAFVGVLLWRYAASERSKVELEAQGLSREFSVALDREIGSVVTTLQALATSPSLASRDYAAFYKQAIEVGRLQNINITLRDAESQAILTTRAPFGATPSVPAVLADADREVLRTGRETVTNIFTSSVTRTPVFQIVSPVRVASSDVGFISASIDLNYLAEVIRKEHLPSGWLGAFVDRNGVFVARTERHEEFAGRSASADFKTRVVGDAGSYYGQNSDDTPVLVAYSRSKSTGWIAAASLPAELLDAPVRKSVLSLVSLGLVLAALATAVALLFARRLGRAFDRLTEAAAAIGRGQDFAPVVTSVPEIDAVGRALMNAAKQIEVQSAERNEREKRLELVIEGAKDHAIIAIDPVGEITSWSAGAETIFGWSKNEIITRNISVIFTPEDREAHRDEREVAIAAHDGVSPDQRWHLRKDGTRVFMNGSVYPLPPDAFGRQQGFIKIARDETERLRAEGELRELNETLEAQVAQRTRERNRLWEATNDLIGRSTIEGRLLTVNPAWTALLGWNEEELLSRPFADFVDAADQVAFREVIAKLQRGESVSGHIDQFITKSNHRRYVVWSAVPEPEDSIFYIVGRDITEQRRTEETLRQSQKMEAVGQLTGGIAHDFNNMLAVIIGGLNLLQRRLARGDTKVDKYVDGALEGATRAAALTQRLLAFSRQQPMSLETIDPNKLVGGMTDLLTRALGERTEVQTVLSAGLWKAKADSSQLENAVLNLAVNARDAMPEGGKLTIETANAHVDEEYARENVITPGQYVMIAVSDTGSGMSADVIGKAFDPFFTTKKVGQGTGLGLSQVFGFARQLNGHAKIYSEIGHGTTVKIYLPRSYDAVPANTVKASPPSPVGHAREIILVVEDEDRVRSFSVEVLRDLGYTAIHASNGKDALRVIDSGQDVTLLFTDVVMPGITGRQLADAATMIRPGLKVLYATGYTRNAVVHNGVIDPGTNLLLKPFSIDQLGAAVRHVLDS